MATKKKTKGARTPSELRSMFPRLERASAAGQLSRDEIDDYITWLGVVADPKSSREQIAEAVEKLTKYFESLPKKDQRELSSAIRKLEARVATAEKMSMALASIRTLTARAGAGRR